MALGLRFRLPRTLAIAATIVAVLVSAFPASGADPTPDPRLGRQANDPIKVAREQRIAIQARIASQQDHLAALNNAGTKLTTALQATTDTLSSIMVNLDQLQAQIAIAQADLDAAVAQRDGLQQQVESLDWSLNALSDQADELAADLDNRRRELGARLADAYREGQTGLWEQVMGAGSFLDAIVQQQGSLTLGDHDRELAASIEHDQALLDEQRLELRQLRYQTDQLRTSVAAQAEQIGADRDQLDLASAREAELQAQTVALQAEQQAKYAQVLDNQARVAAIIARQQTEQQNLTSQIGKLLNKERHSGRLPSAFNGVMRWPEVGPISQEFGCTHFPLEAPFGNCDHFHPGIDIANPSGSAIHAPADGVILWVGYETDVPKKDANYYVMIAVSDHVVTILGHLQPKSPRRIKAGAKVTAGQTIGWEGDTGNSTGPHLHWGIFLDGTPQNPRYFL
jgi:murein DD-endopeptidase MepM/ murein hydrolase activator NlpD